MHHPAPCCRPLIGYSAVAALQVGTDRVDRGLDIG
jgi:hypothetical protein